MKTPEDVRARAREVATAIRSPAGWTRENGETWRLNSDGTLSVLVGGCEVKRALPEALLGGFLHESEDALIQRVLDVEKRLAAIKQRILLRQASQALSGLGGVKVGRA